ncbi:hypothetical protein FHP05_05525 [Cerasibacillus terrae]|uniref:Serine protease n=1 Tax=Cerasibacillus terrae TaxID=2498845 RepID=A0A5C8P0D7_9BACI|nr:hypothetical protein [Cerasibacillus terrae]TXL66831.1 hypothetical protein FHP05_05525 [Cerasibacillus terrae]
MDHLFINNVDVHKQIHSIKKEIRNLQEKMNHLEEQLSYLQQNCQHVFNETDLMRRCVKCHYTESLYY